MNKLSKVLSTLVGLLVTGGVWAFDIPVTFDADGMGFISVSASGPTGNSHCEIPAGAGKSCTLTLKNGRHLVRAAWVGRAGRWKTTRQVVNWSIDVPNDTNGITVKIPSHEVTFNYSWPGPRVTGFSSALFTAFGLDASPTNKFGLPEQIVLLTGSGPAKTVRMMDGCYVLVYTWPNNQSGGGIQQLVVGEKPVCVGGDEGTVTTVDVPSKP